MEENIICNVFSVHKDVDGSCRVYINEKELPCVKDFSYKKTSAGMSTEVTVIFDVDILIDDFNEKVFQ